MVHTSRGHRLGFTLVELLIVIGMIGILATGGFASYVNTQRGTRDAKRKTDIETIRQGLEMYKSTNGVYVNASGSTEGTLKTTLSPNYINTTSYPADPQTDRNYYYSSVSPFSTYTLCARLENLTGPSTCASPGADDCGTGISCNYGTANP